LEKTRIVGRGKVSQRLAKLFKLISINLHFVSIALKSIEIVGNSQSRLSRFTPDYPEELGLARPTPTVHCPLCIATEKSNRVLIPPHVWKEK
jgi:hypothetical protein